MGHLFKSELPFVQLIPKVAAVSDLIGMLLGGDSSSFQDFHDCISVLTLAFRYSVGGISGPSGYDELRLKFQVLYDLGA